MSTTRTLSRYGMTETYSDIEKLLYHTVQRFRRRYGGDTEELVSEANEHFVDAYRTYNGSIPFKNWLSLRVFLCLKETIRERAVRHNKLKRVLVDMSKLPRYGFDVDRFTSNLSDDAEFVVRTCLQPPKDIMLAIRSLKPTPKLLKKVLHEYLTDCGWTESRISNSFVEVSGAVTGMAA